MNKQEINQKVIDYLASENKDILIYQSGLQSLYYSPGKSYIKSIIDLKDGDKYIGYLKINCLNKELKNIILYIDIQVLQLS